MSLNSLIDKTGSECLNQSDSHPFTNALTSGKEYLESDCDEQLIIALAFHMPMKLHSLQIVGPPDGELFYSFMCRVREVVVNGVSKTDLVEQNWTK